MQSGLESLVRRECEKIGLHHLIGRDRLVSGEGNDRQMYELLVWSRFANRVYLDLAPVTKVKDFDALYSIIVHGVDWQKYIGGGSRLVIDSSSTRSTLTSTPRIQSVAHRAMLDRGVEMSDTGVETHILILLIDDEFRLLLDITGDPLHKRGYRHEAGEAPIKESLGAGLVALSGWRYRNPLIDPFCGSGTIAIEAAMMARNIAPGLYRDFRVMDLPFSDPALLESVREQAEKSIYPSGEYQIMASDSDPDIVTRARENARRAGVAEDITFSVGDFRDKLDEGVEKSGQKPLTIVTNPPYGRRLQPEMLARLYEDLLPRIRSIGGGCITSYPAEQTRGLANRKLQNGGEECRWWYTK